MMDSKQVKQFIKEKCKSEIVGIAPATPFSEEDKKRVTATLETLKEANPVMTKTSIFDPEDFVDGAKSVIVFGSSSRFAVDTYAGGYRRERSHGEIGNLYLSENILDSSLLHASLVKEFLEANGFNAELPFIGFPQKIKALEAGLGVRGKNTLVINKKLGSWISLSTIITDATLETDEPLEEDCGKCKRCVEACPTGALFTPYIMQVDRCVIYYLCHLKEEMPVDIREKIGVRTGNCTTCSDVCPRNGKLYVKETNELPEEMIYSELIAMMKMDEDEYERRYGSQIFGFVMGGLRYLKRNIAVALGNADNEKALPCLEIAARGEDPLIRSHAAWAIEKIRG